MSKWDDQFEAHVVHTTLNEVSEAVVDAAIPDSEDVEDLSRLARTRKVRMLLSERLAHVDPELLPPGVLESINQPAQTVRDELRTFVSNGNSEHIANSSSHTDQLLNSAQPLFAALPAAPAPTGVQAAYRKAVESHLIGVAEAHGDLETKFEESRDSLQTNLQALESKVTAANTELANQRSRTDEALNRVDERFTEQEDARKATFDADREQHATALDEILATKSNLLDKLHDNANTRVSSFFDDMKTQKTKIEKLVHVIGNTGMVGDYQRIANSARHTGWFWKAVTVASMIGLIGFARKLLELAAGKNGEFDWTGFGTRVFVAAAFGILAAYAAKQGEKQDDIERYNRRMELELASLDPYLASLPEEKQHEIKDELAKRMFGKPPPEPVAKGKTTGTTKDMLSLFESLKDFLPK